jgi:DNA invertase Pin-like site-specific DNA recombinase
LLLDGYIRVSQVAGREGESFISPGVQRDQIEAWAKAHGATLANVYEELDESGARGDRPLLMEALARVEAGESGGVVVAKLDRFGRSVVDGLSAIRRIEQAGGTFISVQDGFDLGTPTGRLVLQFLLSIGEWELGRVRDNWNVARARAIGRGAYVGRHPIGYLRDQNGRLQIDPEKAPIVREIFARRSDGEACREIAAALNEAGARTRRGLPFNAGGVHKILSNPAYYGEARHGEHRKAQAHEPLVDRATWQCCQHTPPPRNKDSYSLLAGLVRCASCGRMTSSSRIESASACFHVYRCNDKQKLCPGRGHARGDELDPLLEEFVFRHCGSPGPGTRQAIEKCESAVAGAERRLAAYRDRPSILEALGAGAFAKGLGERQLGLEKTLVDLARARQGQSSPIDVEELERDWQLLTLEERREALAQLIDCVIVESGSTPLRERAWVFRAGKGPISLVEGRVTRRADSLSEDGERLRRHRRWSQGRIERELREFLAERTVWPFYREFSEGGRARLWAQVMRCGSPYYWGHRLGIEVPPGYVRWNEERIGDALRPFLARRDRWPRAREFVETGLQPLYQAAQYHGGFRHWSEQFGLDYGKVRRTEWTSNRIAKELARFTQGRGEFPTRTEFHQAGLSALYDAASRTGGIAYWVSRLEIDPSPRPHELATRARRHSAHRRQDVS